MIWTVVAIPGTNAPSISLEATCFQASFARMVPSGNGSVSLPYAFTATVVSDDAPELVQPLFMGDADKLPLPVPGRNPDAEDRRVLFVCMSGYRKGGGDACRSDGRCRHDGTASRHRAGRAVLCASGSRVVVMFVSSIDILAMRKVAPVAGPGTGG